MCVRLSQISLLSSSIKDNNFDKKDWTAAVAAITTRDTDAIDAINFNRKKWQSQNELWLPKKEKNETTNVDVNHYEPTQWASIVLVSNGTGIYCYAKVYFYVCKNDENSYAQISIDYLSIRREKKELYLNSVAVSGMYFLKILS